MGIKTAESRYGDGSLHGYLVRCPACGHPHLFDKRWKFNGNLTSPTFEPSMLVTSDDPKERCHSYLREGVWEFLPDSGHAMRGRKVPAPDFEPLVSGMSDTETPKASDPDTKASDAAAAPAPATPATPPTPPTAAEPPAAPAQDTEAAAREEARAARKKAFADALRSSTQHLFDALMGPEVNLTRKQAALVVSQFALAVYGGVPTEIATHGKSEIIDWTRKLPQFNPPAWFALKDGNVAGFVAALAAKNVKVVGLPLPKDAPHGTAHEPDVESYEYATAVLAAP